MSSAAQGVYENDVIFRNLIRCFPRPTLRNIMMVEQRGDKFDWCVEELWRIVNYEAVMDMTRDTERNKKYLDAVTVVNAAVDLYFSGRIPKFDWYPIMSARALALCSVENVQALRDKCPNLRLITREDQTDPRSQYVIKIRDGKPGNRHVLCTHTTTDIFSCDRRITLNRSLVEASKWVGWDIEQTAKLCFHAGHRAGQDGPLRLLPMLWAEDRLDERITEIDTANLVVPLETLLDVVDSRVSGRRRITRIRAAVKPFTLRSLELFLTSAGPDLELLDLPILDGQSSILTMKDLPFVVGLIRQHCPRLTTLRIPLTATELGTKISDSDIPLPPSKVPFHGGTLQVLGLYLFGLDIPPQCTGGIRDEEVRDKALEGLLSFNATRNLACIAGPACEVNFHIAERVEGGLEAFYTAIRYCKVLRAVGEAIPWFGRLGPILDPHFRSASLSHLGVSSLSNLKGLRYQVDGTPMTVEESRAVGIAAQSARRGRYPDWQQEYYYLWDMFDRIPFRRVRQ